MKFIITFFICIATIYLTGAFISLTFNPAHWESAGRAVTAIIGIPLSVAIAFEVKDREAKKHN